MRVQSAHAAVHSVAGDFASDVQYYLSQHPRQLPSKYLYDDLGSALFDAITLLPWYPLSRAESRLIRANARDVLFSGGVPASTIVELGPGNGAKLASLMASAGAIQPRPRLHLVDVSPSALARAAQALGETGLADVTLHAATYQEGLAEAAPAIRGSSRTIVAFLGSNIGNFDPPGCNAFLHMVRAALRHGDALLLGADLVKAEPDLLLAYDDPLGVTAAFNRNLLVRMNRELGATIDPSAFEHRAIWNAEESRIEMHLGSTRDCRLMIPAAEVDIRMSRGETIWTESSYKYDLPGLERTLRHAGFEPASIWIDDVDRFALVLAEVQP